MRQFKSYKSCQSGWQGERTERCKIDKCLHRCLIEIQPVVSIIIFWACLNRLIFVSTNINTFSMLYVRIVFECLFWNLYELSLLLFKLNWFMEESVTRIISYFKILTHSMNWRIWDHFPKLFVKSADEDVQLTNKSRTVVLIQVQRIKHSREA